MKNRIIQKGFVWGISILLVCGIVGGFWFAKQKIEEAKIQAQYEPPKAVMTQDEMEELYDEHKNNEITVNEIVLEENAAEATENIQGKETENRAEQSASYECPVDFEGMWKINEDVYAWITIPGTVIDYPVLQHAADNTYYLNYNIDGSYGYPGCIYTENMNSKDFTDNNTVIYGHNMKNGTMFADLHKYEDFDFFNEYDEVLIYTPEKKLTYTIFAAYIYDDRHLLYSFNFADDAVYANYLNDIQSMRSMNANIREDITVTSENKIITLATCIGNQPDKRLLVQAVLLEDGE